VPGLLAALLAMAAQPAAAPSVDEFRRAIVQLAGCHGGEATRRAEAGTETSEAIVAASFAACREHEQRVEQILNAMEGADTAQLMADLRAQARRRMLQTIAEARGAPRVRGEGDESLAWGECTRREGRARAGSAGPVEAIVAATRQACTAEEQAARAALMRSNSADQTEQIMAALLASLDETVRAIVASARAGAR